MKKMWATFFVAKHFWANFLQVRIDSSVIFLRKLEYQITTMNIEHMVNLINKN